mmetsp:Transcript_21883/g.45186  ORF Transcript_21883/g.45186 Transcript_21883/m.45186 type:complete len:184 (+) Transcript_21883:1391-1942(+)
MAHVVMAITGLNTSLRIEELGIVTVLCHQSREEYLSERGRPPRTAASRIITLSTLRGVPAVIHPSHFSRRLVSSFSAALSRSFSVFLIFFVSFFSLLLEDGDDDDFGDDELSDFDDEEDKGNNTWPYGDRNRPTSVLLCGDDEGARGDGRACGEKAAAPLIKHTNTRARRSIRFTAHSFLQRI